MQMLKLDINPKGEIPVLYVSQYDNGREFSIELVDGEEAYNVPSGYSVQLNVRKTDSKLVTKTPETVSGNMLTFVTTEQMTACAGNNIASLTLKDASDIVITTLYFIIEVQRDVLAGGLDSASEIDNLTQQIEDITQEVIGNDYYNKTETDALLADKADVSDLPDMSLYYTKTATDTLLNAKADKSDTYTKAQVDTALAAKVNTADLATVATSGDYDDLINKPVLPDMTQYYTKSEVDAIVDDIFPTFTASGDIATFTTALNKPLVSVTADAASTTITRCGKNFININGNIFDTTQNPDVAIPFEDGLVIKGISRDGYVRPGNITKFEVSGDDIVINTISTSYGVGFAFKAVEGVTYEVSSGNNIYSASSYFGADGYNISFTSFITGNRSFTIPSGCAWCVIIIVPTIINTDITIEKLMVELGSTATAYEPYNSQTVPVADATALTTLSGVNNVFADSGDVTVQYKYMSM